jgi:hypothetical protein
MIIRIKKRALENVFFALYVFIALALFFIGATFTADYVTGADNITNFTIIAVVNVTNTQPNITSVSVDDSVSDILGEIDLTANGATVVTCNATVFDYNGFQDITYANHTNATLFIAGTGSNAADDNNTHYTNQSCGNCIQAADAADPARTSYCFCNFAVQYYANASSNWVCNFGVRDNGGTARPENQLNHSANLSSGIVTVTELLAINVSTVLDYGNLSVTQTSPEIQHNVTNGGNLDFNLTLRGYAGTQDFGPDDPTYNLTMLCTQGNISTGNQRFSLSNGTAFSGMTVLPNSTTVTNLTFPQRIDDSHPGPSMNSTYWQILVPFGAAGTCNGTIVFGAVVDGQ